MNEEKSNFPRLLHVAELSFSSKWFMSPHSHPDLNELIVVIQGQLGVEIHGQKLVGCVGRTLFYPRGVVHAERVLGSASIRMLYLTWVEAPGWNLSDWPLITIDRSGRMQQVIRWMMELLPSPTADDQRALNALLLALLHEYRHGARGPRDEMLAKIRRFIQENLARSISVEMLAEVAFLSPFHFSRVFRESTGQTPMAFLRRARIDSARALISTSNLPLREIAKRVGFADEIQLCRVFKRITGCTPGACRANPRSD